MVAGVVAVAPIAPRPSLVSVLSPALRLVDASSLLNVPLNLFQDFVNIPGNEVEALEALGNAQLYSGTWFTPSATNIFGEDPGDPGRFMSIVDLLVPFKAISGQGIGELGAPNMGLEPDVAAVAAGHLGLGQQVALIVDAELPVSASSDADNSAPLLPVSEITGFTGTDRDIWSLAILSGQQQFPLLDNYFQVPLSQLMEPGFNFGDRVDPSPGVGVNGAVPGDDVYGIPGTHPDMVDHGFGVNDVGQALNSAGNPINLLPWSNLDYTLNLAYPFQNFSDSLQAPFDLSAFNIPSLGEAVTALQTFTAGNVVAFDPYVPGSPVCQTTCGLSDFANQNQIVQGIGSLFPGNTSINHYLDLVNNGTVNTATASQIAFANEFLSPNGPQSTFDIGNPLPDAPPTGGEFAPYTPIVTPVSPFITNLIDFAKSSGIQNFAHELANANGYVPVFPVADAVDPSGIDAPTAEATSLFDGMINPADWSNIL